MCPSIFNFVPEVNEIEMYWKDPVQINRGTQHPSTIHCKDVNVTINYKSTIFIG